MPPSTRKRPFTRRGFEAHRMSGWTLVSAAPDWLVPLRVKRMSGTPASRTSSRQRSSGGVQEGARTRDGAEPGRGVRGAPGGRMMTSSWRGGRACPPCSLWRLPPSRDGSADRSGAARTSRRQRSPSWRASRDRCRACPAGRWCPRSRSGACPTSRIADGLPWTPRRASYVTAYTRPTGTSRGRAAPGGCDSPGALPGVDAGHVPVRAAVPRGGSGRVMLRRCDNPAWPTTSSCAEAH